MRFLEIRAHNELAFTKDLIEDAPEYAILSHTWGPDEDEVNFEDVKHGAEKSKAGYEKIRFCSERAQQDGLHHFWVDTCCIDRANHTELASAIVSMYQWYRDATKCYVFLSDVCARKRDHTGSDRHWETAFEKSRWFKRGWTLQELLAPSNVEFYSREGLLLGDKKTLEGTIHRITGIPIAALRGAPLSSFSAEERMQWTSGRDTKRVEDQAYCLLGIFDVSMPPIYGEGSRAFDRLKDEIGKAYRRDLEKLGSKDNPTSRHAPDKELKTASMEGTTGHSLPDHRDELLKSLRFEQMDSRRSTITTAYSTTCQWLLEHPAYLEWNDPENLHDHGGFLWIKGKPGAGKSTLVKFACAHADTTKLQHDILISFFFNARGDDLEKSATGMYRALLFQLLSQCEDLRELLDNLHQTAAVQALAPHWSVESLTRLLSLAMGHLKQRRLHCFVDALDECDEDEVRDMVLHFEELAQTALQNENQLFICFASRHYPTIDISYGCELVLEDEGGHGEDLAKYVQHHLRAGKGTYINTIRAQILEKANSVFLWVVLVVNILNKEFRSGRIFAVKKRLEEVPVELSDLFKDMLRRDQTNMADLLLCIQWILYAKRPLSPEEFYFAMVAGLDPDPTNLWKWDPEKITIDDMVRFVSNSSKGLAEVTKGRNSTVQFIHESVRDFLVKDNGVHDLWPEQETSFSSIAHDRLKHCCQNYLVVGRIEYKFDPELPDQVPIRRMKASSEQAKDARQRLTFDHPFLRYASQNILHHADEAAVEIAQHDFLESFALKNWIEVTNTLEQYDVRRYTNNATLLYIVAERNLARLIATIGDKGLLMNTRGERYRYPIFAAIVNGHQAAVQALLRGAGVVSEGDDTLKGLDENPKIRRDHTPLLWAVERGDEGLAQRIALVEESQINSKDFAGRSPLLLAVQNGFEALTQTLLALEGIDADSLDTSGRTALSYAAEAGNGTLVKCLLDHSSAFDDDKRKPPGYTSLDLALANEHYEAADLLIAAGANIERQDFLGRTTLLKAARAGNEVLVGFLLDKGANIKARDTYQRTAFLLAAENGSLTVLQMLLDTKLGVNVDDVDKYNSTALSLATTEQQLQAVKFLIGAGSNIEHRDFMGRTPLLLAAAGGNKTLIHLLVDQGADLWKKCYKKRSALAWATVNGHLSVIQSLLKEYSLDVNETDENGVTALGLAIQGGGYTHVVEHLLAHNAYVEAQDKDGRSPLSYAAESRYKHIIRQLVSYGTNMATKDHSGKTALMWVLIGLSEVEAWDLRFTPNTALDDYHARLPLVERQNKGGMMICMISLSSTSFTYGKTLEAEVDEIISMLISSGVPIDAQDLQGNTALLLAIQMGIETVVQLLLDKGANPEVRDNCGNTALMWATKGGYTSIVQNLLARGVERT